ncbi:hypothetical protein O3G_MSEX008841 [Manduca sexta]|uniref:Uncharacterized protein n=1 Tax=Manduca sexta TaxID=7130 RepID=A0A921ZB02_MANSE|nr:hypothetical protein O3G_MSEX008841 [Manduca sexta]KAG6454723.1 hypothetical protein O3G_MSEX008841 [Manduca sexta]
MKCLFVLVAAAFVVVVSGQGIPIANCPKGEHSVLYCPQMAEPDCDIRVVHDPIRGGGLCDIPQCFCDVPTIRNLKTGKCVMPSEC